MPYTFTSFSFGCRVNEAERQEFDRTLQKAGFVLSANNPDFCIINTCAVTQKAEREARQLVYHLNRKYPNSKIILTGCAATYWLQNGLWSDLPVDLIIRNKDKENLAERIKRIFPAKRRKESDVQIQNKFMDSQRLLVKIQDGCNRFCNYCIVPSLRGLPRSYPILSILKTLNTRDRGIKEVILTAINTEAYGQETDETLSQLVESLLQKTDIPRISFGSVNPWSITPELIAVYKKYHKTGRLVNFFHIPVQSGSNKVLSLMKRGYTVEEFQKKLELLRALDPFTFIATDVIVGFLGETEKEFEETYSFLETSPISKFHIFRFSLRKNTQAYLLSKTVLEPTAKEKASRAKRLAGLGKKKYETFLKKHIGHTFSALFLERRSGHDQSVLLSNQIPAQIKTKRDMKGLISQVRIDGFKKGGLFGTIE